jgi:hypothetical protein
MVIDIRDVNFGADVDHKNTRSLCMIYYLLVSNFKYRYDMLFSDFTQHFNVYWICS